MTDREIVDLFHTDSGRERAFTQLIEKYQQKVYWHIRRIVLEHNDANDVMQNTFLKVWKGLENFRADAQLFTWLYRIATNECINHINTKKKHAYISFDGDDGGDEEGFSPSAYIKGESNPVDGENIQKRLKRAIEGLPDKQRLVFCMRYYDEMPYEQMSEVLGTSVGALKASYHHAAQKIEKFILGED